MSVLVLGVGLLSGCVTPALNSGAFRENAKHAVESAISATASAQLALGALQSGQTTRPFTDVVVTDSETAIAPIQSSFGGVDPPTSADDALRKTVNDALSGAGDALSEARIAVRNSDDAGIAQAATDLKSAQQQLEQLQEQLQ